MTKNALVGYAAWSERPTTGVAKLTYVPPLPCHCRLAAGFTRGPTRGSVQSERHVSMTILLDMTREAATTASTPGGALSKHGCRLARGGGLVNRRSALDGFAVARG
ncbi:MAG: hypothetical protein JO372_22945 [Solirubrobacterales bacterium]|nr:hypothetical protein [Solirubrobacterales bacterium]